MGGEDAGTGRGSSECPLATGWGGAIRVETATTAGRRHPPPALALEWGCCTPNAVEHALLLHGDACCACSPENRDKASAAAGWCCCRRLAATARRCCAQLRAITCPVPARLPKLFARAQQCIRPNWSVPRRRNAKRPAQALTAAHGGGAQEAAPSRLPRHSLLSSLWCCERGPSQCAERAIEEAAGEVGKGASGGEGSC